jgi:nucleotide-binding universal stress UspA family protein
MIFHISGSTKQGDPRTVSKAIRRNEWFPRVSPRGIFGAETGRRAMALRDVLLSPIADLGTDMIVAGAYHHSHLREELLGGVTRDLLDHMTVPVLMSH